MASTRMLSTRQGQRADLLVLAAFAVFVACAGSGVLCQNDQWIVSGNAQLVEVSLDDLSELSDNNDTLIDSSLPGVMGAHTRKLLSCPAHSSNTPNFISIAAQHYSTLSFGNMNKVGFSLTQEDGSSFSIRVINSNGDTVIFPNDYWGQSWLCIEQAVLKYANCPGSWSVQIACDNAFAACNLYYSISAYYDTSSCSSPPPARPSPPPPATRPSPPPPSTSHPSPPPPASSSSSSSENCQCTCCVGNGCSATLAGSYNAAFPGFCTVSSCVSAYPDNCPTATMSGSTMATYISASSSSSSSSPSATTYKTADAIITLDNSTVSADCRAVSFFQCVKSYSVSVSGTSFTLTSTSGTQADCGVGIATVKDNGADATGSFTDGTIFSATNNGASILVDVDDGVCIGQYYVTSGGPVLGVSMENTSGGSSYASLPMAAILGLAVAILGMQM